jgi:hypothetical protein
MILVLLLMTVLSVAIYLSSCNILDNSVFQQKYFFDPFLYEVFRRPDRFVCQYSVILDSLRIDGNEVNKVDRSIIYHVQCQHRARLTIAVS